MAGIAILLDLISKNPILNTQTFHSCRSFSATLAASAAAATVASPLLSRASFGFGRKVAYCDAGAAALGGDVIFGIQSLSGSIFEHDTHHYNTKEYYIVLKPLFSAFQWKSFALVSLRSFLLHFLPLLEPNTFTEEDEDVILQACDDWDVDLVVPFKKSIKQIIRETAVVTTRRILERLSVYYASQRTAWKLLKDVSVSAMRKAGRDLPNNIYFFRVSRSTFRGHFLGVAASWLVQVVIDVYRFLSSILRIEESDTFLKAEQVQRLKKNVYTVTIRCGASLIFASIGAGVGATIFRHRPASIGAGVGATIFRPSTGQLIGCAVGDLAGPTIMSFCFKKFIRPAL